MATAKTLANCVEEFVHSRRATGFSHQTCIRHEQRLSTFNFPTLTPQSFERYVEWLVKRDIGNTQRNNYLNSLKAFGNWCVQHGYIPKNPVRKMGWHDETPNRPVMNEADVVKLKAFFADHPKGAIWTHALTIGWHTGLRLGDVCLLRWANVDTTKRVISLIAHKTKRHNKRVEMPYGNEVTTTLSVMAGQDAEFVCRELADDYQRDVDMPARDFKRYSWSAGVRPAKSFNCTRHSLVTRLIEKGASCEMVGSVTGQSPKIVRSYIHVGIEAKKAMLGIV